MNRRRNLAPIFAYFVAQIVIAQDFGSRKQPALGRDDYGALHGNV